MESPVKINAALLPAASRHATILGAFAGLAEGQELIITNDHDPQPLFYELKETYPGGFAWHYLKQGPSQWVVLLSRKKLLQNKTVSDLVLEDLALAKVFEAYGIDFCCHGNISLEEACRRHKLELDDVLRAIKKQGNEGVAWQPRFDAWSVPMLINYIVENHHTWERRQLDEVDALSVKVADHHGDDFPSVKKVREAVAHLKHAIVAHFAEEEEMLFPMILEKSKSIDLLKELERMKVEHAEVGVMLTDLTLLTNNFEAPAEACSSFRILYHKLRELKQDLLQHINLENNLLASKAVA